MFRTIEDFTKAWSGERESTLKILGQLTEPSLSQCITPEARTLGRLAWHLTQSHDELLEKVGLHIGGPDMQASIPATPAEIVAVYDRTSRRVLEAVPQEWTDAKLLDVHDMYGERWSKGMTLYVLIVHEAHHRGQMTVLLRQAGLKVPGVYGPAREEWTAFGMPPMD